MLASHGIRSIWISVGVVALLLTFMIPARSLAQKRPAQSEATPEMLVTTEGLLTIDTPKGWVRSEGPGLAFFLRKGESRKGANAWIDINSAPIGPDEEDKDLDGYIESDISGFKKRFKNGTVNKEAPIDIHTTHIRAQVYTFLSAEQHNAYERIAYIGENGRVLILVLSAMNRNAFAKSLPDFEVFVKSYRGSIMVDSDKKPL